MSEMAYTFDALKEQSKERRADNRVNSAAILRERGVRFDTRNDGAHLIVVHNGHVADFWPGTGKFRLRSEDRYYRGVFNLLRRLGVKS